MAHEHAPGKIATLAKLRDTFEVVAVVDDSARRLPSYHTDLFVVPPRCPVISEAEAMQLTDIDVVFIEVANAALMEVARKFAERDIAMHCDKPCGENLRDYKEVLALCEAHNVPLQIGYMYRANPALKWCQNAVRQGLLGDVHFIEADMNHAYGDESYQHYVGTFAGGILYNLGCHLIDTITPMVHGELRRVTSSIANARGDSADCLNRCASFMQFDHTDVLIRSCSRAPGGVPCRRLRIDGSLATIDLCPVERFDGQPLKLTFTDATGSRVMDFGVQHDRYAGQLLELAQIVRGEKPNDQDYANDLRVHELTLRACGYNI